ncbi:MAG: protein kinase [Saprospiraceae bacterium]|nr:protein kinase [Saprospiraceae bacterium]
MDKSLWEQLKPILEIALTLDPSDRDAYLKTACSGNLNLHDAALNLLANESPVTFELSQAIRVSQVESAYHEGQILGHYKLIEEIGRGGMGTVFLAERTDGEYDQRVAIKILQVGRSSDSLIQKLRNERQILANLKHPNIVNILDGGTSDQGIPFIVMEYVDGTMITDYIEEHNLNLQQKLNLFQKLCEVISLHIKN